MTTHSHAHTRAHNSHALHPHKKNAALTLRKAKSKMAKTKESLSNSALQAREKAAEVEKTVTAYVKKNPLKSVGFAVLAGVVVAQILRFVR